MNTTLRNMLLLAVVTVCIGLTGDTAEAGDTKSASLITYDEFIVWIGFDATEDELLFLVESGMLDKDAMLLAEILLLETKGVSGLDRSSSRIKSLSGTVLGSGR